MRDNDLVEASLLAFRLNKLRDFFFAMDRLVTGRAQPRPFVPSLLGSQQTHTNKDLDPVESIIQS